jgi:FKBP-type peptidyl-prolyl cis-trans isomerase
MKNIFLSILAVFTATVLLGCDLFLGSSKNANFDKDSSYALGLVQGDRIKSNLEADAIRPDFSNFLKGFKDGLFGKKPRISMNEANAKITIALTAIKAERDALFKQKETAWFEENSKRPGIQTTKTGLQYEVLVEGKGKKPTETDSVKVHYEGKLLNGTLFDNTYERQETATIAIKDVIPGWVEGLQLMSVGSKYRFYVPYALGYGEEGRLPQIPPYSTLLFSIELVDIVGTKKAVVEEDYWW